MTDAAAAPSAAPIETPIHQEAAPPTPISNEAPAAPEAKVDAPKEVPSTRDALRAAAAKVEAREAAKIDPNADPAKDPNKGADLTRGTDGKFAAKDPKAADPAAAKPAPGAKPDAQPAPAAKVEDPPAPAAKRTVTAPERFSNDAKAVWDTAPEPVKAEVDRMHRELTAGFEKHRAGAESFEKVRRFDDMAKASGKQLDQVIESYVNMENLLRTNPMKGLETVCDRMGVSLRQVAEIVMGQTPDQARADSDSTIRELRQTVQRLEQQIGGVTQGIEKQRTDGLQQQIESWAAKRPAFDIYAPHIATEIREGAANLDEAEQRVFEKYPQLAELAKQAAAKLAAEETPAKPDASSAPAAAAAAALTAQTEKGSKSITGAPTGGSEPIARKPSGSIKEALKRAAARASG